MGPQGHERVIAKLLDRDGFILDLVAVPLPAPAFITWRQRVFLFAASPPDKPKYVEAPWKCEKPS